MFYSQSIPDAKKNTTGLNSRMIGLLATVVGGLMKVNEVHKCDWPLPIIPTSALNLHGYMSTFYHRLNIYIHMLSVYIHIILSLHIVYICVYGSFQI